MTSTKTGANSKTMRTVISLRFARAYGSQIGPHTLLPAYNESPPVTPQTRLPLPLVRRLLHALLLPANESNRTPTLVVDALLDCVMGTARYVRQRGSTPGLRN